MLRKIHLAIEIHDGWDVAHHHIYEGFIHLGEAFKHNNYVYQKYRGYVKDLHWNDLIGTSMEVKQHFIAENKLSIKAVILFQAGVEAWISWAFTKEKLLRGEVRVVLGGYCHPQGKTSVRNRLSLVHKDNQGTRFTNKQKTISR